MDKEILKQYIDACEQVKEAKVDILRLKKNRKKIVQDRVSGSAHEFPYTAKSFHIEGLSYPVVKDPDRAGSAGSNPSGAASEGGGDQAPGRGMVEYDSDADAADYPVQNF